MSDSKILKKISAGLVAKTGPAVLAASPGRYLLHPAHHFWRDTAGAGQVDKPALHLACHRLVQRGLLEGLLDSVIAHV